MSELTTSGGMLGVAKSPRGGVILLVDDDEFGRATLKRILVSQGFDVREGADGLEAMALIEQFTPDLILTDYMMPGLDGIEFSRALRQRDKTRLTPIIMITGVMGTEVAVEALDAGVTDFLNKPSISAELLARVRSHLRAKYLVDQLEDLESIILSMSRFIEAKDPYTIGHNERVAELSVAIGEMMELSPDELRYLRIGGLLHDVGKIGTPDAILLKPGALTDEEREVVERHPVVGEEICRPITSLTALLHIIRHHHERLDGSGYPDGLKGVDVPPMALIVGVCDVYDALTSKRPYRDAMPLERAKSILAEMVEANQLDGDILRLLLVAIGENGDG